MARRISTVATGALLALAAIGGGAAHAATIVVETTGDPAPVGLCGLRDAIVAANTNAPAGDCAAGTGADVIDLTGLSGMLFVGGASLPPAELPPLASELTVRGPGADRLAIAGNGVRIFRVESFPGVRIEGLTLQDGDAANSAFEPGLGGCLLVFGTLVLRDSRLTGCGGQGALYVMGGLTRLERVLVDANRGAGLSVGGITGAGAIVIENSTVSGNEGRGLELVNFDGPGPNASVYASTFVENGGSNLYVPNFSGDPADFPLRLSHVLLASGEPNANCAGQPVVSLGNNLANDDTCALDAPDDLPATPANVGPLADNGGPTPTHAPFPYGDAVDSGAATCPGIDGPLGVDQRGFPRPRNAEGFGEVRCDRGAVEVPEPASGAGTAASLIAIAALARGRRACQGSAGDPAGPDRRGPRPSLGASRRGRAAAS
jgi:hypothetical protein